MPLIVQKFGGAVLGTAEDFRAVAQRLARWRSAGCELVVVVAARSGETARLVGLARELSLRPDPRELDVAFATGAQVAAGLLSLALRAAGVPARSHTGRQARVLTDGAHGRARILGCDLAGIRRDLQAGAVPVVAGGQGEDARGNLTTLGRGGADLSAVVLAAALQAEECRIHAAADGVFTADPGFVPQARRLPAVAPADLLEMTRLGTGLPQARAVELAAASAVPLRILSGRDRLQPTLADEWAAGTRIEAAAAGCATRPAVAGIVCAHDAARIVLKAVPDHPDTAHRVLAGLREAMIEVGHFVRSAVRDGSADLTLTVPRADHAAALALLAPVVGTVGTDDADPGVCTVSVVGSGVHAGGMGVARMLLPLAAQGFDVQLMSTRELSASVVVAERDLDRALPSLHDAFGLHLDCAFAPPPARGPVRAPEAAPAGATRTRARRARTALPVP